MRAARRTREVTRSQADAATRAGLLAAGNVMRNEVVRSLRGGYRSSLGNRGRFVTGASVNHVRVMEPVLRGIKSFVKVGTDLLYNLFWELGHHNLFTRRFERDQRWRPAMKRAQKPAAAAFARAFTAALRARRA